MLAGKLPTSSSLPVSRCSTQLPFVPSAHIRAPVACEQHQRRRLDVCMHAASADVELKEKKDTKGAGKDKVVEEDVGPHPQPSSREVEGFLSQLVNHTDIAEMSLQVGSFELKVKRSIGGAAAAAASAAAAPQTVVIKEAPPPPPQPLDTVKTMDESMDESLVYVSSPKVGIFTRGKYAGGKRVGKGNVANKGDQLKKGQTLGYVEQLGTYVPVEAPQAGEVVDFLVEEGAPVEYKQTIVEMAPFFGGHIIGDSKYA
ncbi:hypothetical protein DUNSADRAFT_5388 [Dunaliella salina]|uniref:Lipoyl-binding domain-containing protein n=1 Tax=Dunaliella salina TaxID=3046 RepID=A0ABQ7GQC2_DUNSA|nr:hypothetical protein DUNSADRAFT_5388 [Dunaliella salina]|eukprot:KAF5836809.1 hypothetical protein DUNSADRAFT_5388 [Dunaliella salina]